MILAATMLAARSETMTLGYSEGKFASGSPMGSFFGDNPWVETAIMIPQSTVGLLAGNRITGVNGWLNSIADVETTRIWIRTSLDGEDLAEFTLVPNQLNKVKKGMNSLKFKEAWTIPADLGSDLYIGFGHKIKSNNARGLSANTTPVPGAFFLHGADDVWRDCSDRGTACMEAVIEGDNLPATNLHFSKLESSGFYVNSVGKLKGKIYVHNFGTQTVSSFDLTATLPGGATMTRHFETSLGPNEMGVYSFSDPAGEVPLGIGEAEYVISNVNGSEDLDPADNRLTGSIETISHDYPRYVLSEEFTTEMCGNCPEVIGWVHELLAQPEFANVIQVAHHAGYKTDFLTEPWHNTFVELFGGGSFAPGLAADRAEITPREIVFFPTDKNAISELWTRRLNEPAVVGFEINA